MKDTLVIDYTELDFPDDGFKFNEGHVILESLKKSELDHIVISTGKKDSFNTFKPPHRREYIAQGEIAKEIGATVISPGDKQKSFDFNQNWFEPEFLRNISDEYEKVILNFHSIDPRNLHIAKRLTEIPDNFKMIYTAHDSRDRFPTFPPSGDFSEFIEQMEGFISFSKAAATDLNIEERVKYATLGVDENKYYISDKDDEGLVIATHVLYDSGFHPYNIELMNHLLCNMENLEVVMDVSKMNLKKVTEKDHLNIHGKRLDITNFSYGLKDSAPNPFENIDAFYTCYKTKDKDITLLKALMSGIPIIAPQNPYNSDILDDSNSITFKDEIGDFKSRRRAYGNLEAFDQSKEIILNFDKQKYNNEEIRDKIIKKGYTADKMIKDLDRIYKNLS